MKKICPARPRDFAALKNFLARLHRRADVVEIWLDEVWEAGNLENFYKDLNCFLSKNSAPKFLGVVKSIEHGGKFRGQKKQRIEVLKKFLGAGGDWVDADFLENRDENFLRIFPQKNLVLSWHDFETVPENLDKIFGQMQNVSPEIYKFAFAINSPDSFEKFLHFTRNFPPEFRGIFCGMGKMGADFRTQVGEKSWAQFFAIDAESRTASGQEVI